MKIAVVIIGIMVAVVAVACDGDSDSLTLQEYFAEFDAIDATGDAEFEELFVGLPSDEEFAADESNLQLGKDTFACFSDIVGKTMDGLGALAPPSEVATEHEALVVAGDALLAALEEDIEAAQEATTMDEFIATIEEGNALFGPEAVVFRDACLDVVAVGEANGVAVGVTCEDE